MALLFSEPADALKSLHPLSYFFLARSLLPFVEKDPFYGGRVRPLDSSETQHRGASLGVTSYSALILNSITLR